MEIYQLKQFLAVAELQNMNKAAEQLSISQPALSQSIARLEEDLGVKLFDRHGKKIVINENGIYLEAFAQKILSEIDLFTYNIQSRNRQLISIMSTDDYFETFILPFFMLENNMIDVMPTIGSADEVKRAFRDGYIDVAICSTKYSGNSRNIKSVYLFDNQIFVSVPLANPLSQKPYLTTEDLTGQPILKENRRDHHIPWFDTLLKQENPEISYTYMVNRESLELIKKNSDFLYFTCAYRILNEEDPPNRRYCPLKGDFYVWPVYMNYRIHGKNGATDTFCEWVKENIDRRIENHSTLKEYVRGV